MSERIVEPIVIKLVSPGGEKLKHCYFLPAGDGMFDFFSKHGRPLNSGLKTGTDFSFLLDQVAWNVSNFCISDTAADGRWTNPTDPESDFAQEGTFQAQAGGGADLEHASTAAV